MSQDSCSSLPNFPSYCPYGDNTVHHTSSPLYDPNFGCPTMSPLKVVRNDAGIFEVTNLLHQDPPSPRDRAMARVGRATLLPIMEEPTGMKKEKEPSTPVMPFDELPAVEHKLPKKPTKKRKTDLFPHSNVTLRSRRRVNLQPAHISEMRVRFEEVMDLLDPVCPTCSRRLSDCPTSCERS
ncbi:MAG: hypothetical protein [Circular genetic element sp.]|nr:MAG: hypothetical protein [Circular genetic element sp.]